MYSGHLQRPATFEPFSLPRPFCEALEEMQRIRFHPDIQPQRIDIRGKDMYLMIQRNHPEPRQNRLRLVESHLAYADVHLCLDGGEYIDVWDTLDGLDIVEPYNVDKDVFLWEEQVHRAGEFFPRPMRPHSFVIFLPQDAHRPNIYNGAHKEVVKVVAKVNLALLDPNYGVTPRLLGPYEVSWVYGHMGEATFPVLIENGGFDHVDSVGINNYFTFFTCHEHRVDHMYLVDMGKHYHLENAAAALKSYGLLAAPPEMVLAMNWKYPFLMDDNPIVCVDRLSQEGKDGHKAMMLHKHGKYRRLRRHYVEAGFGGYVRVAAYKP